MDEDNKRKPVSVDLKDISKISNINAMYNDNPSVQTFVDKKNEPKVSEKEDAIKKAIDEGYQLEHFEKYPRKFDFVQPEKVALPSHGLCYQDCEDEDVKAGYIWIYPMTMKEEEILSTNKYIYDGTATIMALNNCIKSNISAMDLLVSDFYFLLLYLRKISISDEFLFDIKCPYCGTKFKYKIKISDQVFGELDPATFEEPIRVDLQKTNYTVLLGLPRIKAIREMSWFINNLPGEIGIAEFLYTRTIAIISSTGQSLDKKDWIYFYNNLPHADSELLMKNAQFDNGMQHIVEGTKCPSCDKLIEGSSVDLDTDALFRF